MKGTMTVNYSAKHHKLAYLCTVFAEMKFDFLCIETRGSKGKALFSPKISILKGMVHVCHPFARTRHKIYFKIILKATSSICTVRDVGSHRIGGSIERFGDMSL